MAKTIRMVKLTTPCTEKATGLRGMVTHAMYCINEQTYYVFQPKGLNPEDGQPLKKVIVELERLELPNGAFEDVEIPSEILGTNVTDMASGFTGMAVEFVRHANGCFHVVIQPAGKSKVNGEIIRSAEFDLRQCAGPKIKKMSQRELATSKRENPSPSDLNLLEG